MRGKEQGISFEEFRTSLQKRKFASLYLFYGEEEFLIKESLDLLTHEVLDESTKSFNLDIVYGGDADAKDIVSLASSFPMMGDRRIVIVKEVEKLSNRDLLLPYIEKSSSSTSLCCSSSRPDFRTKFFKSFVGRAELVHCRKLYDSEVPVWIRQRVSDLGEKISQDACQLIQAHVGSSLHEIQNEINKLIIYVGEKKLIDPEDVSAVVGMSREFNVFELQKVIGQKNMARSLEILERMLNAGESPLGLIIMLSRYFQKVALVQDTLRPSSTKFQVAAHLGISPYFIDEYIEASRLYTKPQIDRSFRSLLETDEALKSTGSDPRLMMTVMLYHIVRPETMSQGL